jgi:hypothetical protein
VRPPTQVNCPRREHIPPVNALALRCAGASFGRLSCGVQDRVRERQEGLFDKPASARMQRPAIGGDVTIGIATYNNWALMRLTRSGALKARVFDTRDLKEGEGVVGGVTQRPGNHTGVPSITFFLRKEHNNCRTKVRVS